MPTYTFLSIAEKRPWASVPLDRFSQAQNIMAIYHLNIRHCSRSKGQSAQAKFDYINRNDKYSKKLDDLQYSQSGNMPSFAQNDPELFWQSADQFERANARVCTEIEFALPRELNLEQQQELVTSFIKKTIDNEQRKLPYSYAIHNDRANNNPHCHLVFSVRKLDGVERKAEQFFKRANSKNAELGGAKKDRNVIQKEFLQDVRKIWREQANQSLERYGHTARIDERSYQEQGIDKEPRSRLDRVTWQELTQLERQEQQISKALTQKGQEIAQEKAQSEKLHNKAELNQSQSKCTGGIFSNAFRATIERELSKKGLKTPVEREREKDKQIHREEEKSPQNRNQGLSQQDFDRFLVKNWLEPCDKYEKMTKHRDKLRAEYDAYEKDLSRLKSEYAELNSKNRGFLGLWESKEQKQQSQALKDEFEKIKVLQNNKRLEHNKLNEQAEEFNKSTLDPMRKQIEQIQANNPQLEMRNQMQLRSMQFEGVAEWHTERQRLRQEREQYQAKRELERQLDRFDDFSL